MTRVERLDAVIAKVAPASAAHLKDKGRWLNRHPNPGQKHILVEDADDPTKTVEHPSVYPDGDPEPVRHSGAPYVIDTLPSGQHRVRVYGDDGDVVAGVGNSLDDALAAVEQKVGLAEQKAEG